jgi:hypothetical protein
MNKRKQGLRGEFFVFRERRTDRARMPHAKGDATTEQERLAEERRAKQNMLIRLRDLRRRGVVLTREFTMDDSIDELQYELDMQEHMIRHMRNVQIATDHFALMVALMKHAVIGQRQT